MFKTDYRAQHRLFLLENLKREPTIYDSRTTQSQPIKKAWQRLLKSYSCSRLACLGMKMYCFVKQRRKQERLKFTKLVLWLTQKQQASFKPWQKWYPSAPRKVTSQTSLERHKSGLKNSIKHLNLEYTTSAQKMTWHIIMKRHESTELNVGHYLGQVWLMFNYVYHTELCGPSHCNSGDKVISFSESDNDL